MPPAKCRRHAGRRYQARVLQSYVPVTTTVPMATLYRPELVVEIAAVAEIPH